MFERECVPYAPALIDSMRFMGYSFPSAIADLIDNSISAKASHIAIVSEPSTDPVLSILDNGYGMSKETLYEAMRYGSQGPSMERSKDDLGRFGLGMKAASLSQCRKLIVASKQRGSLNAYSWDLDFVVQRNYWTVQEYSQDEISSIPEIGRLMQIEHGTLVVLSNFDRLKDSTSNISESFNRLLNDMIDHLALVFHRFVSDGLVITVNGSELPKRDPFLTNNPATQRRHSSNCIIHGETVCVTPYILPHITKLSKDDIELIGGKESMRSDQGFYIYRNKRLIIKGTWFRLGHKSELNKLARVMVDIPNALDYLWSIDIKKSAAVLPDIIKNNLYNAVLESTGRSESVHTYRGRKEQGDPDLYYVWEKIQGREGVSYVINRDIPQLKMLESALDSSQIKLLDSALNAIEQAFPGNAFYADMAKGNIDDKTAGQDELIEQLWSDIAIQLNYAKDNHLPVQEICQAFMCLDLYAKYPQIKKKLQEAMQDE